MTLTLYGIPNCDTVKKARAALDARSVAYVFHDYKKSGVDPVTLQDWVDRAGWERLLNRSGTTFRKLPEAEKADLDAAKAIAIMTANPSAIRRPVIDLGDELVIGFDPERYGTLA
jgi:arsenate reductase (glutaredoxin)